MRRLFLLLHSRFIQCNKEKTSGVEVYENQCNLMESLSINGSQRDERDVCPKPERLPRESSEFKMSWENLQNSLLNQKAINEELMREIGMMRSRFAGTVNMMKNDIFQLIEETNILQLKEKQNRQHREYLMSQVMSEIEQLKTQNQENMDDHQATIQEQHTLIQQLKTQEAEKRNQIEYDVPIFIQDNDVVQDKLSQPVASDDKRIKVRSRVKSSSQRRNVFHKAGHKVSKRFSYLVRFSRTFIDYTFELFVFMVMRNLTPRILA